MCSVHALTDRAVRVLVGISERRASVMAHVSRDTLTRHERGEEIRCEALASRLAVFYAWLRIGLSWSATATKDDDVYSDEREARTIPPPPMSSGEELIEAEPETVRSTRAA